jgi:hypothetical protein
VPIAIPCRKLAQVQYYVCASSKNFKNNTATTKHEQEKHASTVVDLPVRVGPTGLWCRTERVTEKAVSQRGTCIPHTHTRYKPNTFNRSICLFHLHGTHQTFIDTPLHALQTIDISVSVSRSRFLIYSQAALEQQQQQQQLLLLL